MPIGAPSSLGRYELIREVARSNDVVFEAWDPKTQRRVALKVLNLPTGVSSVQEQDRIKRFEREARAAARLHHPNIVVLFDFGTEGEQPFLVFEFVQAPTLAQLLEKEGKLEPRRAAGFAAQILSALSFAHSQGVIHRDIKPSNIFVCSEGLLKITDLGIARIESEESVTSDGQVFGTPAYMAPEQVRGQLVDRRADIWAAGVVLYEMLTGVQPFGGGSVLEIGSHVLTREPDLSLIPDERLREVIAKALSKDVEARYANAEQMDAAIQAAIAAPMPVQPLPTLLAPPAPAPVVTPKKKRTLGVLGVWWAAALLCGTVGALVFRAWPSGPIPQPQAVVRTTRSADDVFADAWEHHSLHQVAEAADFKLLPTTAQLDRIDTWFRINMAGPYFALSEGDRQDLLHRVLGSLRTGDVAINLPRFGDATSGVTTLPPSQVPAPGIRNELPSGTKIMPGPYNGRPNNLVPPAPQRTPSTGNKLDIGSSSDDVRRILGKPEAIEYTPGKERWFYPTVEVTFINGAAARFDRPQPVPTAPVIREPQAPPAPIVHVAASAPAQDPPIYHSVDLNDLELLRKLNFHATSVTVHNGIREYSGPDGTVRIR